MFGREGFGSEECCVVLYVVLLNFDLVLRCDREKKVGIQKGWREIGEKENSLSDFWCVNCPEF